MLEYINDDGITVEEEIKPEMGDYDRIYDTVYQMLTADTPGYVKEPEVLINLEVLEYASEQTAPATITLVK